MLVSSPFQRFVRRISQVFPRTRRASRLRRTACVSPIVASQVETLEGRALLSASAVVVNSVSGTANYASNVTISQLDRSVTPVTLRDAVDAVNNTPGAATISFDSTVFGSGQTSINLGGTMLELTNTTGLVTIAGSTTGQVSINGGGLSGVFQVDANVNAQIDNLTITGGAASLGAGINNLGTPRTSSPADAVVNNNGERRARPPMKGAVSLTAVV